MLIGLLGGLQSASARFNELPADPRMNDFFGTALAIEGDWLAIGAPGDNDRAFNGGSVYLYDLSEGQPRLKLKLYTEEPDPQAWFGSSLAMDRERLIVGATRGYWPPGDTPRTGSARIFRLDGDTWLQEARLELGEPNAYWDTFGSAVAISGERAAVVTKSMQVGHDYTAGFVDIFERVDGQWGRVSHYPLAKSARVENLAFLGERLVIPGGGGTSSLLVFVDNGESWVPEPLLEPIWGNSAMVVIEQPSPLLVLAGGKLVLLRPEAASLVIDQELELPGGAHGLAASPTAISVLVEDMYNEEPNWRVVRYSKGEEGWVQDQPYELGVERAWEAHGVGDEHGFYVGLPDLEIEEPVEYRRGRVVVLGREGAAWTGVSLLEPQDPPPQSGCRMADDPGPESALFPLFIVILTGARRRGSYES